MRLNTIHLGILAALLTTASAKSTLPPPTPTPTTLLAKRHWNLHPTLTWHTIPDAFPQATLICATEILGLEPTKVCYKWVPESEATMMGTPIPTTPLGGEEEAMETVWVTGGDRADGEADEGAETTTERKVKATRTVSEMGEEPTETGFAEDEEEPTEKSTAADEEKAEVEVEGAQEEEELERGNSTVDARSVSSFSA